MYLSFFFFFFLFFFLRIRRPPRSTLDRSSAASDVYKRQGLLQRPFVLQVHLVASLEETDALDDLGDALQRQQGEPHGHEDLDRPADQAASIARHLLVDIGCLLYTSPSPRDRTSSRMPSYA